MKKQGPKEGQKERRGKEARGEALWGKRASGRKAGRGAHVAFRGSRGPVENLGV